MDILRVASRVVPENPMLWPVVSFTKESNLQLAKYSLKTNELIAG